MTMRSAPPCSSHFAEIPVPAPAPMIGSPRPRMARRRARMSERAARAIVLPLRPTASNPPTAHAVELGDNFRREIRVVDMLAQPDEAARCGLPDRCFKRSEKLLVGIRIRERPTWRIERRDAAFR